MTTPRIANIEWAIWQGQIQPLARAGRRRQRLGGSGDIVEQFGLHAEPSPIEVVNWATSREDAIAAVVAMMELQSSVVACVDAHGITWPAVYIERVQAHAIRREPLGAARPTSPGQWAAVTHRVAIHLVLVAQQNPADVESNGA